MARLQALGDLYNKKIYPKILKTCESLGDHNSPLYAVLAIAVFKGIMRPTFTMMDKKSDKETKKYAAFREGLTEVIAFCSYIVTHSLFDKFAPIIAKKTGKSEKKVANGFSLLSVCLTAGILIPAICNVTLKPTMDFIKTIGDKKKNKSLDKNTKLDIKEPSIEVTNPINTPTKLSENNKPSPNPLAVVRVPNNGMKVGG